MEAVIEEITTAVKNVPTLRFPEFKEEWKEGELRDLGEVITGSTPSTTNAAFYNGAKLFVSPGDIDGRRFIISTKTTLTEAGFNKCRAIKAGSIFFVCIGSTIGKVAQAAEGCATNQQINSLVPYEKYNPDFVYFLLEKKSEKIKELAATQAVPIINKSTFSRVKVFHPSLFEQQRISSFFTAVDDKIQQLTKKKDLLEKYKKGVMQQIFSQQIGFKDENGQDFPEWTEEKLGSYLIKHDEKATESNQYPVLTSSRTGLYFQKDYYSGNEVASADNTGYNVVPRGYFTYRHMSDDLVFKFNINNLCDKGIVSTLYPVFTTNEKIDSEFLRYKLNEGLEFKKFAVLQKQGGSRTYMYYNKLENLKLKLPILEEQKKINKFLFAIENKINLTSKQLEQVQQFKKGLLQQMFV